MQIDFHYGVTKLVARAAGFDEDAAQIIGYAAQYTDDATAHRPIPISGDAVDGRLDELRQAWGAAMARASDRLDPSAPRPLVVTHEGRICIDPVCTAHSGMMRIIESTKREKLLRTLWRWADRADDIDVQKKVYVPFHFIPAAIPGSDVDQSGYVFSTAKNGGLAALVLDAALDAYQSLDAADDTLRRLGLVAIGIALHSFADTWAHEGFSGRKNNDENDIADLVLGDDDSGETHEANLAPNIGHAEALHAPDQAHLALEFQFENTLPGRSSRVKRDNWQHFTEAADTIFGKLAGVGGKARSDWASLSQRLERLLQARMRPTDRLIELRKAFLGDFDPILELYYGPMDWEHTAKGVGGGGDGADLVHAFSEDTDWFLYHAAAAVQRAIVLNALSPCW